MNDPHVEALIFEIIHSDEVDYKQAAEQKYERPEFSVHVVKSEAKVVPKRHFANPEEVRSLAEPFFRSWELAAALSEPKSELRFEYVRADVVDRAPTPGATIMQVAAGRLRMKGNPVGMRIGRNAYPAPSPMMAIDANVELMFACYRQLNQERRTLLDAAYFCLTVLEGCATSNKRDAAARRYGIERDILHTIGDLTGLVPVRRARRARP